MRKEIDSLLVSQLKEGDIRAFEELYERYSAKLYNSVSLILYNKDIAKDITQSSFLTIWEKRAMLDPEKNFPAYLYTIARNLVYKETERLILSNKFVESSLVSAEPVDDSTIENLNNTYIEEYIGQLVGSLPQVPKKLFLLKREKNLSNKEIAAQMDMSERAVEAHLYRTLKYLKEKLRDFTMMFLVY
jgi:RNA polymerase sigma factor, sigma-70 family